MEDFLPMIVVAIAIFGAVASMKNKSKQPGKHTTGENFPFPWLEDFADSKSDTGSEARSEMVDEMVIDEGVGVVGVGSVEGERSTDVERAISIQAQAPMQKLQAKDDRSEAGKNFDLEQAVVYSAILNPKFDDNIF